MKKINNILVLAIGIFIFFISYNFDSTTSLFFRGIKFPLLDSILSVITNFGVIILVMLVIPLIILYKKNRKVMHLLIFAFITSFALAFIIKLVMLRQRPIGNFTYPIINMVSYSFPSMHSMVAFALLPLLLYYLPKQKNLWVSFAFLTAFSRIYFNFHYLSDVVFGVVIGYFIGKFLLDLYENKKIKQYIFEMDRQIFHILLGLIIVILLWMDIIGKIIISLIIAIGLILSYLSKKIKLPIIFDLLQIFERKEDIKRFPGKGIIFYFIGVYIALLLFTKEIAMASITILALGDSVSHLFGLHFGKIKHPLSKTKFFEGTIAGFIAGFIGALFFLPWHEAFFASLAAMIIEAIEIKIGTQQVDDNLIVPFVAGAVVWVIRIFSSILL